MQAVQLARPSHLASVLQGKVECEADNTLSLEPRRDLQAFNNAREALVFQTRVLSLRILSNNSKIDVVMASREARQGLAQHNRGVDVELLSHGDVPRVVTG